MVGLDSNKKIDYPYNHRDNCVYNKHKEIAMKSILAVALLAVSMSALAGPPILVDRHTGKYLGNLSSNQYDPNSTSNPYGRYGSQYSQDSVNNPYGQYGSQYSNDSPNNPYATNAPAIVAPQGNYYSY